MFRCSRLFQQFPLHWLSDIFAVVGVRKEISELHSNRLPAAVCSAIRICFVWLSTLILVSQNLKSLTVHPKLRRSPKDPSLFGFNLLHPREHALQGENINLSLRYLLSFESVPNMYLTTVNRNCEILILVSKNLFCTHFTKQKKCQLCWIRSRSRYGHCAPWFLYQTWFACIESSCSYYTKLVAQWEKLGVQTRAKPW